MTREFDQITWNEELRDQWRQLLRLAIREDLGEDGDWTTNALVPEDILSEAWVVAREPGVIAGLPAINVTLREIEVALREIEPRLQWTTEVDDGQAVASGERIGLIEGPARGILAAERLVLNVLGRLSGIATLTRAYVDAVAGTKARIYDTRKTTPGWRLLEKYAVRCGGGRNHRTGLHRAVLIKDNHLALGAKTTHFTPAEAVERARRFAGQRAGEQMMIEVEVDTLEQLDDVLPAGPDIVLLDNIAAAALPEAVARRDACDPAVELEASGGVNLDSVADIARSGVERISVGALTRSAVGLDLGLDWAG